MIPWLLVWELLCKKNSSLADLTNERKGKFPSSGEINFSVSNAPNQISKIKKLYKSSAKTIDELDGLSMCFEKWRFNIRESNTENFIRLNVETKNDKHLLIEKTEELKNFILNV